MTEKEGIQDMIKQRMEAMVKFFRYSFVSGARGTSDPKNISDPDSSSVKNGSDIEKQEKPVYWEFIDDPELKPGYKKTYCYLSDTWTPCDKKDAQMVYVSIFDENENIVDSFHARKRKKTETES